MREPLKEQFIGGVTPTLCLGKVDAKPKKATASKYPSGNFEVYVVSPRIFSIPFTMTGGHGNMMKHRHKPWGW